MTIRCTYAVPPNFPPTDQDPQAQRVQVGTIWVDYVGATPSQADVDAFLNPPERQRSSAFAGDTNLGSFIQTLKGFRTPSDVQTYWSGLSATQKTNAILSLVLYVASKE